MKTKFSFLRIALGWLGMMAWILCLWKLSSIPGTELPPMEFRYADKVAHFGYFFIGGAILAASLCFSFGLRSWRLFLLVIVILAQVGVADEKHQMSTPNRSGNDRGDWLADCAGASAGVLAFAWFYARRQRRS